MAYVAVDKNGTEVLFLQKPDRNGDMWVSDAKFTILFKHSLEALLGRKLTWEDEPVELKES